MWHFPLKGKHPAGYRCCRVGDVRAVSGGRAGVKKPASGGLRRGNGGHITAAIERQTWSMFLLLSAATHMRPVSVP